MDDNGETREDLRVPPGDVGKEIEKKFSDGEQFLVSFCGLRVKHGIHLIEYIEMFCVQIFISTLTVS